MPAVRYRPDPDAARAALRAVIADAGLNREQVAVALWVSEDTVKAWLKPATSKSANPVPLWAIELLGLKSGLRRHPILDQAAAGSSPDAISAMKSA